MKGMGVIMFFTLFLYMLFSFIIISIAVEGYVAVRNMAKMAGISIGSINIEYTQAEYSIISLFSLIHSLDGHYNYYDESSVRTLLSNEVFHKLVVSAIETTQASYPIYMAEYGAAPVRFIYIPDGRYLESNYGDVNEIGFSVVHAYGHSAEIILPKYDTTGSVIIQLGTLRGEN